MSGELVAWLTGCLDEDQQKAEKLLRVAQDTQLTFKDYKRFAGRDTPGWHDWPDVEAMCSRTLADIAAKRDILKLHAICGSGHGYCDDGGHGGIGATGNLLGCSTTALLAQPFADRPGFREEWLEE